jgi:hypothetical protein
MKKRKGINSMNFSYTYFGYGFMVVICGWVIGFIISNVVKVLKNVGLFLVLIIALSIGYADNAYAVTCQYTYDDWDVCRPDNTQLRSALTITPSGCTGTPVLSQSCTYNNNPTYTDDEKTVSFVAGVLCAVVFSIVARI